MGKRAQRQNEIKITKLIIRHLSLIKMCGIIGYIGKKNILPVLVEGLKKLEYRGYDSAGVAIFVGDKIEAIKSKGKIKDLEKKINLKNPDFKSFPPHINIGIAHTRWATHGKPTEDNAHPHCDCGGQIWIAHNGIIENYQELKDQLKSQGHTFKSNTDTEVIAHLIEEFFKGDLKEAMQKALKFLHGAYGLVVMHSEDPDKILAARQGSPLVIGVGKDETIISSDVSGIINHTKKVIYLDDKEIAEIKKDRVKIFNISNKEVSKKIQRIEWDLEKARLGGFPFFMEKEIFEQAEAIFNSMRGRIISKEAKVKLGGLERVKKELKKINKFIFVTCGTARYAAFAAKYMLEEYAQARVEVDHASEFRYRKQTLDKDTAVIAISQSGETADTLAAIRRAKEEGLLTLGIVNAVGSTIARETDAGIYNHIGPEVSVASTKAFVSQLTILILLTLFFGQQRKMSKKTRAKIIAELEKIPAKVNQILKLDKDIEKIAKKYYKSNNFAFLGRKYNASIAMEGALKLKELSYIHAEGFLAGELKHGPLAMIDKNFPSVYIVPRDSVYEKNISNMEEIKARDGKIIAIASMGDKKIKNIADDAIYIPKTLEILTPILAVIPLQLLAYKIAVLRGLNVDRPRNLAKSVTVE